MTHTFKRNFPGISRTIGILSTAAKNAKRTIHPQPHTPPGATEVSTTDDPTTDPRQKECLLRSKRPTPAHTKRPTSAVGIPSCDQLVSGGVATSKYIWGKRDEDNGNSRVISLFPVSCWFGPIHPSRVISLFPGSCWFGPIHPLGTELIISQFETSNIHIK